MPTKTIDAKLAFFKNKRYLIRDEHITAGDELFLIKKNLLGDVGDIVKVVNTAFSRTDIIKSDGATHFFCCEVNYQRTSNYYKVLSSGARLTMNLSCVHIFDQITSDLASTSFDVKRVVNFYNWLRANYGATKPLEEAQIVNKCTAEEVVQKYLHLPVIYNVTAEKDKCFYKIVEIKDRCD